VIPKIDFSTSNFDYGEALKNMEGESLFDKVSSDRAR